MSGWDAANRDAFALAIANAGHGEEQCAQILRTEFGVEHASQYNVNKWKTGAIKQPKCADALREYTARYGPTSSHATGSDVPFGAPVPASRRDSRIDWTTFPSVQGVPAEDGDTSANDQLDTLARLITHQPLLGPEQAQLVSAVTERLRRGPGMTKYDWKVFHLQARLLGIAITGDSEQGS